MQWVSIGSGCSLTKISLPFFIHIGKAVSLTTLSAVADEPLFFVEFRLFSCIDHLPELYSNS
jgi:hypothetical protein